MENHVLTLDELVTCFQVSKVTLWKWRKRKDDPLPSIVLGGNGIKVNKFNLTSIREWAVRNNKQFKEPVITPVIIETPSEKLERETSKQQNLQDFAKLVRLANGKGK